MMVPSQSFLLVDDHEFILRGLSDFISHHFPGAIIGTAKSAEEAILKLEETLWTFLISDVSLPGKSGIELIKTAKENCTGLKTIVLTQNSEIWQIKKIIEAKADAIVLKTNEQQEIINAIKAVSENKDYYTEVVHKIIISIITNKTQSEHLPELTDRERMVLNHIANGLTSKQISEQLFVSEKTIEVYRKNLLVKFDVKNSISLLRKAIDFNLLS